MTLKALLTGIVVSSLSLLACQQNPQVQALQPVTRAQSVSTQSTQTASTGQAVSGGTLSGNFRLHAQLSSKHLKYARDVLVWLPPGYEQQSAKRYKVLYMHDGNNLFDRRSSFGGSEWQVDEHAGQLINQGVIEPVIIVGVYNSPGRMEEYTWYPMDLDGQQAGGQAAAYGRFLVEELKPLIDKQYRTLSDRANTAVMGSSLGGLVSFYIGLQYPQVFSQIGMMSPSIWWKDRAVINDVPKLSQNLKVWVDMGTREGQNPDAMLNDAKNFAAALEKRGFQHHRNLAFHIENGATHSEQAWADRIERPLRFFYTPTR